MISLTPVEGNAFWQIFPAIPEAGVIRFYIEATDINNNTTREPSFGVYNLAVGISNPALMITEYMGSNTNTIVDNYGATEDWIEINNISNKQSASMEST